MAIPTLQAGTVNDSVSVTLVQADGVTPYLTAGYSMIEIVIRNPDVTYVTLTTPSPGITVSASSVVFKTAATTFPKSGTALYQVIVTFPDGTVSKSKVGQIQILKNP